MKSILISIHPEHVAKILNGKKTLEIRKTAPKCDLPIDVYIYCTKTIKPISDYDWGEFTFDDLPKLGKVIAKFALREVKNILPVDPFDCDRENRSIDPNELVKLSCLTATEIMSYLDMGKGHAWHISDLVIFDKPKHLTDFMKPNWDKGLAEALLSASKKDAKILEGIRDGVPNYEELTMQGYMYDGMIKRPPQSWCYVEARE